MAELAAGGGRVPGEDSARELMDAGVSMTAPETVFLSADTQIAAGATIEPYVVFAPGVDGRGRRGDPQLQPPGGLRSCATGALVGPYARLRPGADIGEDAHIGNFVEVKKVKVGKGAKANHLAYLGDGSVGAGANIGAGTIFCNYDGFDKYDTHVGEGAFIGSNSALVAPVTIGDGRLYRLGLGDHQGRRAKRARRWDVRGRKRSRAGRRRSAAGRWPRRRAARQAAQASTPRSGTPSASAAARSSWSRVASGRSSRRASSR